MTESDTHREPVGPQVGVVGLGAMGWPIARNLLASATPVAVYDLDPVRLDVAAGAGAKRVGSARELGEACGVVLVVVPSDDDVLAACTGADGVLSGAAAGGVVLICSSVRPETCAAVADAAPAGVSVLDAALTGGVRGAEEGTINLLVGGDADALRRVRPSLAPWTNSVHHLGPLGTGQVGKTVNNLIHWAQISALYEALELGRRLGVPVSRMRAALMDGTTDSRTLHDLEHMRFTWYAKDLSNAFSMAETVSMDLPVSRTSDRRMPEITVPRMARLLRDEDPLAE